MLEIIQNENTLQLLSTEASTRKAQSYLPNNAQPSVVEVTVPSSSTSLLNKGKSTHASILSEEPPLENGPHSKKTLQFDTGKSSESDSDPSTSYSSSCLPKELPSSSLPPLYSEAVGNGAISVNLEDDTEDNLDSDSIYSNNMTPEEVEAVYNLWRQMPEEQSPWASTTYLLDKLRGVITRQSEKPQH